MFVSLWKHFNGASGAILAGDASFIDGLYHTRRMFGGSLPQAWPSVAVAAQYVERYEDEYARSWQATDRLIALLQSHGRFEARKVPNGTSRFFLGVSGMAPEMLAEATAKRGVLLPHPRPDTGAFPMQVNPTILRTSPEAWRRCSSMRRRADDERCGGGSCAAVAVADCGIGASPARRAVGAPSVATV